MTLPWPFIQGKLLLNTNKILITTHYSSGGQPRQSRMFCRTCVAPIRLIFTPDLQVHTVSRSVRSGLHNKSLRKRDILAYICSIWLYSSCLRIQTPKRPLPPGPNPPCAFHSIVAPGSGEGVEFHIMSCVSGAPVMCRAYATRPPMSTPIPWVRERPYANPGE